MSSNVVRFPAANSFADPPANTAGASLIQLDGVSKTFRTTSGGMVKALDQINLIIGSSEFVSVVGPSGCGKTTLLRIIAGLEGGHGGTFRLAGKTVTGPGRDRFARAKEEYEKRGAARSNLRYGYVSGPIDWAGFA